MTKIDGFNELSDRLKLLRAEIEHIYTELWAAGLHGAKQALDRAIPPLGQAIQSVECASRMEREVSGATKKLDATAFTYNFSSTTR